MSATVSKKSYSTAYHAWVLAAFCAGFGLMLALTDLVTVEDIGIRAVEDLQNSLTQVLPPDIYDNNPATDTVFVKNAAGKEVKIFRATKGGKLSGVAYEVSGVGYAGEIRLIMGVDAQGQILGVRATMYKETPGLGDKIDTKKSDWITRFTGLSLGNPPVEKWKVKKDGGQFDQFTGATITPRGVVAAIRGGLEFFAANKTQLAEAR